MRIDATLAGSVKVIVGVDGKTGWQLAPDQTGQKLQLTEIGAADVAQIDFERWREPELILLKAAEPAARSSRRRPTRRSTASRTGRQAALAVRRARRRAVHRQEDEADLAMTYSEGGEPQTDDFADYKDVGGLKIAHKRGRAPARARDQARAQDRRVRSEGRSEAVRQAGRLTRRDRAAATCRRPAEAVKLAVAVLLLCATAGIAAGQPARLALPAGPGDAPLGPREAEPPIVEVLTFGVGDRIFEKFGHAAICLRYHDPRNQPVCFNYGVTDFDDGPIADLALPAPGAAVLGRADVVGEPWTPGHGRPRGMIGFYTWEDRDIWSQRLPLTGEQARAIETRICGQPARGRAATTTTITSSTTARRGCAT